MTIHPITCPFCGAPMIPQFTDIKLDSIIAGYWCTYTKIFYPIWRLQGHIVRQEAKWNS